MTHRIEIKRPTRAHPHWEATVQLVPVKDRPRGYRTFGKRAPIDAVDIDEALAELGTRVRETLYPVMMKAEFQSGDVD